MLSHNLPPRMSASHQPLSLLRAGTIPDQSLSPTQALGLGQTLNVTEGQQGECAWVTAKHCDKYHSEGTDRGSTRKGVHSHWGWGGGLGIEEDEVSLWAFSWLWKCLTFCRCKLFCSYKYEIPIGFLCATQKPHHDVWFVINDRLRSASLVGENSTHCSPSSLSPFLLPPWDKGLLLPSSCR
jgi:hypothetical protein